MSSTKHTPKIQNAINLMKNNYLLNDKIDIEYHINPDFTTLEEVREVLEQAIFETDVVYYSTAIKFLMENDPSLKNSVALASDSGFEIKDLNSELLATLLLQDILRAELSDVMAEAEGFEDETETEQA